jgi:hypothetical protein
VDLIEHHRGSARQGAPLLPMASVEMCQQVLVQRGDGHGSSEYRTEEAFVERVFIALSAQLAAEHV